MNDAFGRGLSSLPMLADVETRSISAENPDGAKGGGARAEPGGEGAACELGRGWKVRPCVTLPAESTTSLAEIDGPGVIQHIWILRGAGRWVERVSLCVVTTTRFS